MPRPGSASWKRRTSGCAAAADYEGRKQGTAVTIPLPSLEPRSHSPHEQTSEDPRRRPLEMMQALELIHCQGAGPF